MSDKKSEKTGVNRREFVKMAGAAGAGMLLVQPTWVSAQEKKEVVRLAMVGVGRQGKILLPLALKVPGVKIVAVCDIWEYSRKLGGGLVKMTTKVDPSIYHDFDEMLAKEKGNLDGVIIATPDIHHAPMTIKALHAGLNVYCEKEMSNTLEGAADMVRAEREAKKLLQIGHQRRSNPYYRHAHRLMQKERVFGEVTVVNGQWNQLKPLMPLPARLVEKYSIPEATLKKYGYQDMNHFYEWRWFRDLAGGPMADLGSHQVDIFCWFLEAPPSSVTAIGGRDHAVKMAKANEVGFEPECYDHTLVLYEFNTPTGTARGFYQVNLMSSHGGFFEEFMGDKGSCTISEIPSKHAMFREKVAEAKEWEDDAEKFEVDGEQAMKFDPLKSRKAKGQMDAEAINLEEDMNKPAHQPHVENFVAAIRDGEALNCPGGIGYETAVAVLKATESARNGGQRIELKPEDFKV